MAREKHKRESGAKEGFPAGQSGFGPVSAKPIHWVCTACGFAAADEEGRQRHLVENQDDPAHREMIATELDEDEPETEEG